MGKLFISQGFSPRLPEGRCRDLGIVHASLLHNHETHLSINQSSSEMEFTLIGPGLRTIQGSAPDSRAAG